MKGAPNWTKPGDPVNGVWKQDLLRWLGKLFNLRVLVETGTCEGSTPMALYKDFREIYTIELSDYYYQRSVKRLRGISNVHISHGNSEKCLEGILNAIPNEPTLFWLDAHSSGGLTADEGDPLGIEIQIIERCRPNALVVIDDLLNCSLDHLNMDLSKWHREYRTGEVLMHQGKYKIPQFDK